MEKAITACTETTVNSKPASVAIVGQLSSCTVANIVSCQDCLGEHYE